MEREEEKGREVRLKSSRPIPGEMGDSIRGFLSPSPLHLSLSPPKGGWGEGICGLLTPGYELLLLAGNIGNRE